MAISDKALDVPDAGADERNQPMSLELIERTLHPPKPSAPGPTRCATRSSRRATACASCSVTPTPLAPTAQLEIMWDRLQAIRQAVGLVRTSLKALYDFLSDEQKARPNALADSTSARRHGHVLEPQACAGIESRSPEWPTKQIEEAVQPSDQQLSDPVGLSRSTLRHHERGGRNRVRHRTDARGVRATLSRTAAARLYG
jgi:hypothetical protein